MHRLLIHPTLSSSSAKNLFVFSQGELIDSSLLCLQYKIETQEPIIWAEKSSASIRLNQNSRQDELWKTTCLEAFLLSPNGSYTEINLSPEGLWNVYEFDSYRTGMRRSENVREVKKFSQTCDLEKKIYQLTAEIDLGKSVNSQNFRLGLTAVIETVQGEKSYWALKHSGEKPDFHDSRGHILELSTRS